MDKFLKPSRLDVDPSLGDADKQFRHWKNTFDTFLGSLTEPNKLGLLNNFVSSNVFEYIAEATDYDAAMDILVKIYSHEQNKPSSRIFHVI